MKAVGLLAFGIYIAIGSLSIAQAQSTAQMLNECSAVAQTYFRDWTARTEMQYNGQRVDGTHAINGRIFLETRFEDFACSYAPSGQRMVEFFAEGRQQNAHLPGGGAASTVARVTGVASNDVLNVRSGPGTNYGVTGALSNGDMVRRLVCQAQGNATWCQIEMMTDMRERGWVNARFLTESTGSAAQLPGNAGGPGTGDIARVTGLAPGGLLNVRSGPGTGFGVVGALANGDRVRNLGCETAGGAGWCRIEMLTDMKERGWVSARFLERGSAVQLPSPPSAGAGGSSTIRVRFVPGTNRAEMAGQLAPGESRSYVLGARSGQNLSVRIGTASDGLSYQILNPDRTFLLDQISTRQEYRGQLWQSGDHVIEVINRSNRPRSYTANFSIR